MDTPKTIREVHAVFESKKISATELTRTFLKRIKESKHNAFLTVCEERALKQAADADHILQKEGKIPANKPLLGIPLGLKDVLTVDGVRTTCASKILENYIPPYTATSVQRLEDAGAVSLGKLNMDEFAMGASNENSAFGVVEHPTHAGHVPGGSSGGSATAVGADLCIASLGTDTGGSIRLPASFCGIVGVKPTYGRISRYGLIAFASSLDQIGPMTKTVEDSVRLLDVMVGPDPRDSTSAPIEKGNWLQFLDKSIDWKNLKIGIPKEYFVEGINPDVAKAIESSLYWYKKKGAKLIEVSLPHTSYAIATYYLVAVSEASSNLARYDGVRFGTRPENADDLTLDQFYKKFRAKFGSEVKRRIILGTFALSSGYYDAYYQRACQVRRLIAQDFIEAFREVDLIASPVSPFTAFKRGERVSNPLQMYLVDVFTAPGSLAGLPAMSLPCGTGDKGLPIGLQLVAPHFAEEKLLSVANAFEKGQLV